MSNVDQITAENLVQWHFEARVVRVLEDAVSQAKRRNQSTFVRVIWPSESFDLLDAVNYGCELRERTFAWSDADDRRSFVALGAIEERETAGAVRFAQVRHPAGVPTEQARGVYLALDLRHFRADAGVPGDRA